MLAERLLHLPTAGQGGLQGVFNWSSCFLLFKHRMHYEPCLALLR